MNAPLISSDGLIGGVSPTDLHPLPPVPSTSPAAVAAVVARARAAQPAWEALGFERRAAILREGCRALLENRAEFGRLIREEAGKLPTNAQMHEAIGPLDYLNNWTKVARRALKSRKLPINPVAMPGKSARTDLVPRGVIGVIAPWNYPLGVYFKPALPALLCGNSVVLKPSEYAPRTGALFAEMLGKHLPQDVVGIVQGGRDVGKALVQAGIDGLSFTGSPAGGRAVLAACAEKLIPCSAELGGKDPAIVLEDCDLERTVLGILNWALHNSGQDCGAVERVYVVDAIADRFVDLLSGAVARLKVPSGPGQEGEAAIGPLANAMQLGIVEDHVKDAVDKGARLLTGGKRTGFGLFYEPTVLDACTQEMRAVSDETFGPVIPIVRVKDAEEAIRLANDSRYGLNASVWTRDLARGEQIARRLEAGTIFINNHAITGTMPFAPWTGVKDSGYGVANSELALHTFVRPRTIFVDKGRKPDPWWLPADSILADIAERLARAQLGDLAAGLKLPGLMSKRQKKLLGFLRGGP